MISHHFRIEELVDRDTFEELHEQAWQLIHPDIITIADGVRDFFGVPVTVNNWLWGGPFQYRGYRSPTCTVGAEGSYHKHGMAIDFDVKGLSAEEVRRTIVAHKDDYLLRFIKRLEADVTWVHADIGQIRKGASRIYVFKA